MIKDTISGKRGKNRLRKHKDKFVTETLRLMADLLRKADETQDVDIMFKACALRVDMIPFMFPKLQAIAPAEMDSEGNLTPYIAGRIAELVAEHRKALPEGEDGTTTGSGNEEGKALSLV